MVTPGQRESFHAERGKRGEAAERAHAHEQPQPLTGGALGQDRGEKT